MRWTDRVHVRGHIYWSSPPSQFPSSSTHACRSRRLSRKSHKGRNRLRRRDEGQSGAWRAGPSVDNSAGGVPSGLAKGTAHGLAVGVRARHEKKTGRTQKEGGGTIGGRALTAFCGPAPTSPAPRHPRPKRSLMVDMRRGWVRGKEWTRDNAPFVRLVTRKSLAAVPGWVTAAERLLRPAERRGDTRGHRPPLAENKARNLLESGNQWEMCCSRGSASYTASIQDTGRSMVARHKLRGQSRAAKE